MAGKRKQEDDSVAVVGAPRPSTFALLAFQHPTETRPPFDTLVSALRHAQDAHQLLRASGVLLPQSTEVDFSGASCAVASPATLRSACRERSSCLDFNRRAEPGLPVCGPKPQSGGSRRTPYTPPSPHHGHRARAIHIRVTRVSAPYRNPTALRYAGERPSTRSGCSPATQG